VEGARSNLHQNLPWTGGMCVENFIKTGAGVWISISPPHTNRQTDRQTNICTPIYIYREIIYSPEYTLVQNDIHIEKLRFQGTGGEQGLSLMTKALLEEKSGFIKKTSWPIRLLMQVDL